MNRKIITIGSVLILLVLGFFAFGPELGGNSKASTGGDLTILKSEISSTVKFYPYKVGKTNMEVMAVKASDGTIRTAFNTCQVCYDSGRGYYKQQGNVVICQNCGNQFKLDQIEKIKGGCNPIPITTDNKKDDGTNIVISGAFIEENKEFFGNWRKQ